MMHFCTHCEDFWDCMNDVSCFPKVSDYETRGCPLCSKSISKHYPDAKLFQTHTYQFGDKPGKCKDCRQGVFHAIHQVKISTPVVHEDADLGRLFKALAFTANYSDIELRLMAQAYKPFTTHDFQAAVALGKNPLDTVRVRKAIAPVLTQQAATGPFPIVQSILDAIWSALKETTDEG